MLTTLLLWLCWLASLPVAGQEVVGNQVLEKTGKITLAVPPFQEIGNIPHGGGQELAFMVTCQLDAGRYEIKPRLQIKPLMVESVWDKPQALRQLLTNLEAEQFLLGSVSKTGGDFAVFYFIADRLGNVSLKDQVSAADWDRLKILVAESLVRQKLAPRPPHQPPTIFPADWSASLKMAISGLAAVLAVVGSCGVYRWRRPYRAARHYQAVVQKIAAVAAYLNDATALHPNERRYLALAKEVETWRLKLGGFSQQEIPQRLAQWRSLYRAGCQLERLCYRQATQASPVGDLVDKLERTIDTMRKEFLA